jgi:hypothetical protein
VRRPTGCASAEFPTAVMIQAMFTTLDDETC